MNDLAEKALRGVDAARRAVAARPMRGFGVLGLVLAVVVVLAGGRINAERPTRPVSGWFGLQDARGVPHVAWLPGAILLAAVAALAVLWLAVVRFVRRHDEPERRVWSLTAAWGLPFALGPPLLGTSVQSYVAYGLLERHGLDPYHYGASRLAGNAIVAAVEPAARDTPSAAGPLGTLAQHLAVSVASGSALGAILLLRGLAVICVVLIGRLAADLAGRQRSRALTLTVLNPLLLLYLVSAARLEALMMVLVLAALSAAGQRRWLTAVALTCLAGSVEGPAFLLVPAVIAAHWLGRGRASGWLVVGRDLLVAAATVVAAALVVPNGFGWLWTVSRQFAAHPPYSVASAIAKLLTPVVRGASYDDLAAGARITTVTAMVCVVGYLVVTPQRRALDRTAGYTLLAVALLAPMLYPWYLLWGVLCLAPSATGTRRVAVLALSVAGCLLSPPGFTITTTNVLSAVALAVIAAVLAVLPSVRRRSGSGMPVTAGK